MSGCRNIRRLGHKKLIVKTDNEPALISLRHEVMKHLEIPTLPEAPPAEESQSNGSIENAVRLVLGNAQSTLNLSGGKNPRQHSDAPSNYDLDRNACRRMFDEMFDRVGW